MKTCQNCDFKVVFDRSIPIDSLDNLGCGFMTKVLSSPTTVLFKTRDIPQVEPDHVCLYWINEEVSIERLVHPFGAE